MNTIMNMKTKLIQSILLGAIILLSGCYGDLERSEYDKIFPNNFYKNESDVKSAVTAAYHRFHINTYSGGGIYSHGKGGVNIYSEVATDVMDCQWGDGGSWELFNTHAWTASNSNSAADTYKNYKYISQMRNIILNIDGAPVTDVVKLKYIAEVRALRAWLMYCIYDIYGPVPVASDEILSNPTKEVIIPRPSNEVYVEEMVSELKLAIAGLPTKASEWGRVDKGSANMMLLKIYMHEKNWNEAEPIARELMKSDYGYRLLDEYYDCFSLKTEVNNENIWSIPCDNENYVNGWVTHVLPYSYPYPNENVEKWGGYRMPWDFYHTFESKDKRLGNIVAEFRTADGTLVNELNPGADLVKGALPFKYTVDPNQVGDRSGIDVPVFRYSDVLLSLAECIVRKSGNVTQEAMDLINRVRSRVGLDAYTLSEYANTTKYYDMLILERGHEFYCEGIRRTDLIRFGKFIEFNRIVPNSQTADYKVLFPIPNTFLVESKGQVTQNSGY